MSKLKKKELLEWLDFWHDYCMENCIEINCVEGIEKCRQAYPEIVALMKKPKVTERWIKEKAEELREINIESEKGSLSLVFLTQPQAENFIRSLVEEIQGK